MDKQSKMCRLVIPSALFLYLINEFGFLIKVKFLKSPEFFEISWKVPVGLLPFPRKYRITRTF